MSETVSSRIAYRTNIIAVREDTVRYADGQTEVFEVLQLPEGVYILPVRQDGTIILIREYRHNHGWIYSIPMGGRERTDADPLQAAQRELAEEVGCAAERWTHLSTHHNGIYEEGLNHFFLAEQLSPSEERPATEDQIEQLAVSFEDAFTFIQEGKIVDLSSRACIWAGYISLQKRHQHSCETSSRQESKREV